MTGLGPKSISSLREAASSHSGLLILYMGELSISSLREAASSYSGLIILYMAALGPEQLPQLEISTFRPL